MVIICGHTRLMAAKKLGLTFVPVIMAVNLSADEAALYRIADNRIGQESEWDDALLIEELKRLEESRCDLDKTGFDNTELDKLLNASIEEAQEESEIVLSNICKSVLGDIWILDNHRLICGDATSSLHFELLTQGLPLALMVTDPPYGVSYDPGWRDGADLGVGERSRGKVQNDDQFDWTDAYSLFTGDVAYIWHAGKFTAEVAKNIQDCGFQIISQIIWAKQHFALSRGDYHWQHEPCWYVVKKR